MKLKHLGLAAAGLLCVSTVAFAAGLWPDLPVVGSATYCSGVSNSATGTIIGLVTGCPNQVPAGPSIVTGNEQIPADTRLANGAAPQTVLIPMASLNALPITVQTVTTTAPTVSAANTSGGVFWHSAATITSAAVTLPQAPIDGQQYRIGADRQVSALSVSAGAITLANNGATVSITNSTTTASLTGLLYLYNAGLNAWLRLQ